MIEPWRDWDCKDGAELVASRDESEHAGLDIGLALCIYVTVSKIYHCQSCSEPQILSQAERTFVEWTRELKSIDKLGVEARGHLNAHTAHEEPQVHQPQIWLLVPWHLVVLHHPRDNRVGRSILNLEETHDVGIRWSVERKSLVRIKVACGCYPDLILERMMWVFTHNPGSIPQML